MELNTNVLSSLKCLADSSNDFFAKLIQSVFETFLINAKSGSFELNLNTNSIGLRLFLMSCLRKVILFQY